MVAAYGYVCIFEAVAVYCVTHCAITMQVSSEGVSTPAKFVETDTQVDVEERGKVRIQLIFIQYILIFSINCLLY